MKDNYWNLFEKSGKISDYLKYKGYPGCDIDDDSHRAGHKRTSVGR